MCEKCIEFIEVIHNFQDTCLVNYKLFLSYVNQLNNVSKVGGKVNVYLKDYYNGVEDVLKTGDKTDEPFDNNIVNMSENVFYTMKVTHTEGKFNIYD